MHLVRNEEGSRSGRCLGERSSIRIIRMKPVDAFMQPYLDRVLRFDCLCNAPQTTLKVVYLRYVAPDDSFQEHKVAGYLGVDCIVGLLDVLSEAEEVSGKGRWEEGEGSMDCRSEERRRVCERAVDQSMGKSIIA